MLEDDGENAAGSPLNGRAAPAVAEVRDETVPAEADAVAVEAVRAPPEATGEDRGAEPGHQRELLLEGRGDLARENSETAELILGPLRQSFVGEIMERCLQEHLEVVVAGEPVALVLAGEPAQSSDVFWRVPVAVYPKLDDVAEVKLAQLRAVETVLPNQCDEVGLEEATPRGFDEPLCLPPGQIVRKQAGELAPQLRALAGGGESDCPSCALWHGQFLLLVLASSGAPT